MKELLITNIRMLAGVHEPREALRGGQLGELPVLRDAFLHIEDGRIASFGSAAELPASLQKTPRFDAGGGTVLPSFCDSHTHLVFAKPREEEFVMKLRGVSYEEIAQRGGGILNSAGALREMPEQQLFDDAWKRLQELIRLGTGAIEIKSGYGLNVESEIKMLRVIARLKQQSNIPVKATFLGAHAYPLEYRGNHDGYIDLIIEHMLPKVAKENLADYVDAFCEQGFFSPAEMERICNAAARFGLKAKIHTNQLHSIGGVEAAVRMNALSVDHLESMDESAIASLSGAGTIATLLPSASFFLRMQDAPARELIDRNCAVALASDFNPGSSPSGNMNFVVSLACIRLRMLPQEALNAATVNGAFAMESAHEVGSIARGKRANVLVTEPVPSLAYIPYAFGTDHIRQVFINGEPVRQ